MQLSIKDLIFLLILIIISGCSKEEIPLGELNELNFAEEYGVQAFYNNKPWFISENRRPSFVCAKITTYKSPTFRGLDFLLKNYSPEMGLHEKMTFGNLPIATGRYTLEHIYTTSGLGLDTTTIYLLYSTLQADGDVIGDNYEIEEGDQESWVEITEIDTINKEIHGNFSADVVKDVEFTENLPGSPDRIEFRKGSFVVPFQ